MKCYKFVLKFVDHDAHVKHFLMATVHDIKHHKRYNGHDDLDKWQSDHHHFEHTLKNKIVSILQSKHENLHLQDYKLVSMHSRKESKLDNVNKHQHDDSIVLEAKFCMSFCMCTFSKGEKKHHTEPYKSELHHHSFELQSELNDPNIVLSGLCYYDIPKHDQSVTMPVTASKSVGQNSQIVHNLPNSQRRQLKNQFAKLGNPGKSEESESMHSELEEISLVGGWGQAGGMTNYEKYIKYKNKYNELKRSQF